MIAYDDLIDGATRRKKTVGRQTGFHGWDYNGDFKADGGLTAGANGTRIKSRRIGTTTLAAGTVTIADAAITANSRIRAWRLTDGGTVGASYSITRNFGVGLTIQAKDGAGANNTTDTSVLTYEVMEL